MTRRERPTRTAGSPRARTSGSCRSRARGLETGPGDQAHRSPHQGRVVGLEGVLEADAGVEAGAGRILEENPGRGPVAVLEQRAGVELTSDRGDKLDRGGGVSLDGFDQYAGQ